MIIVHDKTIAWEEGLTVSDLINHLKDDYPYGAAKINGRFISRLHFDTTTIPDNTEVFFIPLIAGG